MKPHYRYDAGIQVWMLVHCPPGYVRCPNALFLPYWRKR